jgi:hypothetical protein
MTTATKRVMATNSDTMVNGHRKEGGKCSMAATMANNGDGDGDGKKNTAACTTTGERGMMVAMAVVCVCVFVCVERPQKI